MFQALITYQELVTAITTLYETNSGDFVELLESSARDIRTIRQKFTELETTISPHVAIVELVQLSQESGIPDIFSGYILGCYLDDQRNERPEYDRRQIHLRRAGSIPTEDEDLQKREERHRRQVKSPFLRYLQELEAGILFLRLLHDVVTENRQ